MSGLKPPRRKRRIYQQLDPPFPVPIESVTKKPASSKRWFYYTGLLQENCILVQQQGDVIFLYKMGFFGKGILSKSKPEHNVFLNSYQGLRKKNLPPKERRFQQQRFQQVRKNRYERHLSWSQQFVRQTRNLTTGEGEDTSTSVHNLPNSSENNGDQRIPLESSGNQEEEVECTQSDDVTAGTGDVRTGAGIVMPTTGDVTARTDGVTSRYKNVATKTDVGARSGYITTRTEGVTFRTDDVTSRTDGVTSRTDGVTSRTDCVASKMNGVTSRTDGVSPRTDDVTTRTVNVPPRTDGVTTRTDDVPPRTDGVTKRTVNVTTRTVNVTTRTDDVTTRTDDVTTRTDDVTTRTDDVTTRTEDVTTRTKDVTTRTDDVTTRTDDVTTTFDLIEGCEVPEESPKMGINLENINWTNETRSMGSDQDSPSDAASSAHVSRSTLPDAEGVGSKEETEDQGFVRNEDPYPIHEYLQLKLEEAFFLSYGLGCLTVLDENKKALDLTEMWRAFCSTQRNFVESYVAYHYYRSKGWVPRDGLKYGAHYVLYKHGPPFYHGSYSVIVRMVTEGSWDSSDTSPGLTWPAVSGMDRITETVAKEVVFCYVIRPSNLGDRDMQSPRCIPQFKVQEILMKRWVSSRERDVKDQLPPLIS